MAGMSVSFRNGDYSLNFIYPDYNFIYPDYMSDPINISFRRGMPLSTGSGLQDSLVFRLARPGP